MVRLIVDRERVLLPLQRELPLGDAIGDAADGAAEVLVLVGLIAGDVVEAEDDIGELAGLVGDVDLGDGGAERHHLDGDPLLVLEGKGFDSRAVGGFPNGVGPFTSSVNDGVDISTRCEGGEERRGNMDAPGLRAIAGLLVLRNQTK